VIDPFPNTGNVFEIANWVWRSFSAFASVLVLFLVAYEPIARWTKTEKDNNFLRVLQSWLDKFLPNKKTDGGTFSAYSRTTDAPPLGYVPPEAYDDKAKAARPLGNQQQPRR
jgi:hypothetical protein